MQKDYKQRKKLHIKKRQGVPYTAFSINASLTLEAALVLPVFLAALVAVVFFLQAIQVQSRLQQSLYNQVKKVSGYAYYMNIADMPVRIIGNMGKAIGEILPVLNNFLDSYGVIYV